MTIGETTKGTVLIVEDEQAILESMAACLKKEFHVLKAQNGLDAWEVLKTWQVDCLVTDINMPVMGGIELLEKMRSEDYRVNTIIVTGGSSLLIRERTDELGVGGFLTKPFSVKELIRLVRGFVTQRAEVC